MAPRRPRSVALALCLAVFVASSGCGTLIHPDRRGQTSGKLDPAIVVLDGICLLFFIVPGLIAFGVDFASGAIYLPPDSDGEILSLDAPEIRTAFDPATGKWDADAVAAVIRERTGRDVEASALVQVAPETYALATTR